MQEATTGVMRVFGIRDELIVDTLKGEGLVR